jgi:hypothetical protein
VARVVVCRQRAVLGVFLLCAVMLVIGAGRAVAGTWRIEALPGPQDGALTAVSCSGACIAVGDLGGSASPHATLAERGNLTSWSTLLTAPLPTLGDATEPALTGVSCTSESGCVAVGTAFWSEEGGGAGDSAIAERWNGREWSVLITPTMEQESTLSAVSCVSSHACIAVGSVGLGPDCPGSNGDFCSLVYGTVERWDGRRWSLQPTPKRPGHLEGVSCTSARACVAVGGAVAERWDGKRWSRQQITSPRAGLDSVSCASTTLCTAVGSAEGGGTLIEQWNGKRWTVQQVPKAAANPLSRLDGVSCPSRKFCIAVGTLASGGPHASVVPQVELWNGRRWSLRSVPMPPGAITTDLHGVTCTSRRVCTAVGDFFGASDHALPLLELYS